MEKLSAKLTKKAFKEANSNKSSPSQSSTGSSKSFSDIMENLQKTGDINEVVKSLSTNMDLLRPPKEITAIQSESMESMKVNVGVDETENGGKVMNQVAEIMGEVNEGQIKLQNLMDLITSGQKISPQELIAIQAGVFSLVQELEIASKGTQELTQSARQILNTNIG